MDYWHSMPQTGSVVTMNEPQIWTIIGVLAAALFAVITFMATMLLQVMKTEFKAVRAEFSGELGKFRTEVTAKFDLLDKDIQALTKHVFGTAE